MQSQLNAKHHLELVFLSFLRALFVFSAHYPLNHTYLRILDCLLRWRFVVHSIDCSCVNTIVTWILWSLCRTSTVWFGILGAVVVLLFRFRFYNLCIWYGECVFCIFISAEQHSLRIAMKNVYLKENCWYVWKTRNITGIDGGTSHNSFIHSISTEYEKWCHSIAVFTRWHAFHSH